MTTITLRTFFDRAEPINATVTVPQYLGTLVANATTTINAAEYGRTILDLATRRALIVACEDALVAAYDSPVDAEPSDQIGELRGRIEKLSRECSREAMFAARCLADVEAEHIRWLWNGRIALGKVNLFGGIPDLGKSQLTCAFAAAVTTGGLWPDGERAPLGSVIIIGCEDDAADTIRPRLEAAGADLRKVHLFDWTIVPNGKGTRERRHFDVKEHGAALAELIAQIGDVVLVIIDPITAHLGRTDSHVTADVRAALAPLQTLAADVGAAIILISHLNKGGSTDGSAMNRVTGSGAFIAVCRSAWLIAADPKDSEKRRRILVPIKNNLSPDKSGFAYTIEGVTLPNGISTSRVVFDPIRVHVSADELLQQVKPDADAGRGALEEACDFLRIELKNGPQLAKEIAVAAREAGITPDALKRARKSLGVRARKEGVGKGAWRIELPTHSFEGVQGAEEVEGEYQKGMGPDQRLPASALDLIEGVE